MEEYVKGSIAELMAVPDGLDAVKDGMTAMDKRLTAEISPSSYTDIGV